MLKRSTALRAAVILIVGALAGGLAVGDAAACRVVDVQLTPSPDLQIVVWLEDSNGNYVDTLFITRTTGMYGLGNRPGIMEFNSEFLWPYGRRESTFPIWAHRHGVMYPKIIFQDEEDSDLSHAFSRSTLESHFCRPLHTGEAVLARSLDAGSCATTAFTDKGKFEVANGGPDAGFSLYPPRRDVIKQSGDSSDVPRYAMYNDLDAVSQATPPGGMPFTIEYSLPPTLPPGSYVMWVETSKEFDQNATYHYPSPQLDAYGDYGEAYRGQPSVAWSVPFSVDTDNTQSVASALDYDGYGDPDGVDGDVRVADNTIETMTEGSGAQRLLMASGDEGMYRVRVVTKPSSDALPPDPPQSMAFVDATPDHASVSFVEPAGAGSTLTGYEVRMSVGQPLTAENFSTAGQQVSVNLTPMAPGTLQTIGLSSLTPSTHYWVGVRGHDACLTNGDPAIVDFITPAPVGGEVSWCFVATAAYGSPMMPQVSLLRTFRDQVLRRQAVGELLVESYYTFGPALAAVIRPSDTLRALTRGALAPIVDSVDAAMNRR